ncbi:uncharacterized protein LOC103512008 [Diaphorina citri]|uniref:Uncharacterized protein LOC103512008 n=1 Tax=Diaphorina citri TaxID=121845 RepID=A0A3Q0J3X3_DIACI|nr:uncharacterized protein LOC103512008 [Diaphorina citri]
MQVCTDYMCNHIASSENYVVSWYQYTLGLGHLAHNLVAQACQNYIKWNFESVAETPDFLNFTTESLCKFLTQNDIVVQNEMALLKYVMHWIEYQQESLYDDTSPQCEDQTNAHMKSLVENVICYIRFPMMTRKELAQLLLCPLVRAHKEFFIDRMTIGVAYHTVMSILYLVACQLFLATTCTYEELINASENAIRVLSPVMSILYLVACQLFLATTCTYEELINAPENAIRVVQRAALAGINMTAFVW